MEAHRVNVVVRDFNGNLGESLKDWLFHCEQRFTLHEVTDDGRRAAIMGAALGSTASSWARSLEPDVLRSAERLVAAMKKRFSYGRSQEQLCNDLDGLKHEGTLDDYIKAFQRILTLVDGTSEMDKMQAFKRNLQESVRSRICLMRFETLDELMSTCFTAQSEAARSSAPPSPQNEYVPMQIGAVSTRFMGLCYTCGKRGHKTQECRSKNKKSSFFRVLRRELIEPDRLYKRRYVEKQSTCWLTQEQRLRFSLRRSLTRRV